VRFVLLSGARTGSTVFAYALNSHPQALCFGELFNYTVKGAIDYIVEGYDKTDPADMALRDTDAVAFLRQRIFRDHHQDVRAVGLKYHYLHFLGFPGALDSLIAATDVRVLHLRRRNLLRMFVSLKMAYETGDWKQHKPGPMLTRSNASWAVRHPAMAVARLRQRLAPPSTAPAPSRLSLRVLPDELQAFIDEVEHSSAHYDGLFAAHAKRDFFFEDLEADAGRVFDDAVDFLDLPRRKLRIALERQNPQPLPSLIENYGELERRYRDTQYAWMFD
jgi:hypothetical protein